MLVVKIYSRSLIDSDLDFLEKIENNDSLCNMVVNKNLY